MKKNKNLLSNKDRQENWLQSIVAYTYIGSEEDHKVVNGANKSWNRGGQCWFVFINVQ